MRPIDEEFLRGPSRGRWTPIVWVFDDGGRAAAGYKGFAGDCVCRAIAIATERSYQEVYDLINEHAAEERTSRRAGSRKRKLSSARTGVIRPTTRKIMQALGWTWIPTMGIGTGCRVHLRADELPAGRVIVAVSKHVAAVIDGVLHDTEDTSRNGTRCVYGYWINPAKETS